MAARIRWELVGRGWAKCTVEAGDVQYECIPSYLSDGPSELCRAMAGALRGTRRNEATLADEPGEHLVVFEPLAEGRVCVTVHWHDTLWSRRRDDPWKEVFRGECRLRTLAGSLVAELQRLERELGHEGYKAEWGIEFPSRDLENLMKLLK